VLRSDVFEPSVVEQIRVLRLVGMTTGVLSAGWRCGRRRSGPGLPGGAATREEGVGAGGVAGARRLGSRCR